MHDLGKHPRDERTDEAVPGLRRARGLAIFFAPPPLAADATGDATAEAALEQLELPQVWAYQSWGEFASGGVSLGNVAFELVWRQVPAGEMLSTAFAGIAGIAFEPAGYTAEAGG